jgi:hypothetical protein
MILLPFGGLIKSLPESKFWMGESNLNVNVTNACTYIEPIQGNFCFTGVSEAGYLSTPIGEYRPVLTKCPCGTVTKIVNSTISMGKTIPNAQSLFCATKSLLC